MKLNLKKPRNLFFVFLMVSVLIMAGRQVRVIDLFNKTFFSKSNLTEETLLGGTNKDIRGGVIVSCPFDVLKTPVLDKVVISEVAWMGTAENFNNEWIELKNISAGTVSISGWQLIDKDEQIKIIFPDSAEIPANGFYLLEKGEEAVVGIEADIVYAGNLRNSEESLKLFNDKCNLVDEVSANPDWPAGNNKNKNSMERDFGNFSWYTSSIVGGTPKETNSSAPQINLNVVQENVSEISSLTSEENVTYKTDIVISEIHITNGKGRSSNDFIELYNPANNFFDLSGWQLKKRTKGGTEYSIRVFPSGSNVGAHDYFVWANTKDGFHLSVGADVSSTQTIAGNNSIALFDNDGNLIDALAWGSGHTVPFGELAPYPVSPGAGEVLERKFTSGMPQDTDNNADDFEISR